MEQTKKDQLWKEKHAEWKAHFIKQYENYASDSKLCYADRLELEKKIADLLQFLYSKGIRAAHTMKSIDSIEFTMNPDGTIKMFAASGGGRCPVEIEREMSPKEIEVKACEMADFEVQTAERAEQEKLEEKKREAKEREEAEAYWKSHPEYCQHTEGLESHHKKVVKQHLEHELKAYGRECAEIEARKLGAELPAEASKPSPNEWVDDMTEKLDRILETRESKYKLDGHFSTLTSRQKKAAESYIIACQMFCHAMNAGLHGMELYAQNSARTDAHRELMAAFNVVGNQYAEVLTKQYDFACIYDPKPGREDYVDKQTGYEAEILAYALWKAKRMA